MAFPIQITKSPGSEIVEGLTKREYAVIQIFAAMVRDIHAPPELLAQRAYMAADELFHESEIDRDKRLEGIKRTAEARREKNKEEE